MSRKLLVTTFLAIVAAIAVVSLTVVPRSRGGSITVTAQFDDVIGLYEGNAVSVLGMQVGKVTSIKSKGTYVDVTLEVDKGVDVPADVQAVTVSTSILTDRHVELTPVYRSGPKLKNGDVVGPTRTRTPVEFDKSLAMVDKLSRSLGGDGKGQGPLADLISIGSTISSRSAPDLKATLDQLSQALRLGADHGARSKKDIQAVVTNVSALVQAASDNDAAIRQFGSNLHQLSDVLASEDLGSGTTGKKVNQILSQAAALLENNRDTFKNTIGDAQALTKILNEHRRDLTEVIDVAPLMFDNIYNGIDSNAGSLRVHILTDKLLLNGQFSKEACNILQLKQLGCATGTMQDYGPDFGLGTMLDVLSGSHK